MSEQILVVENDEMARNFLVLNLENEGYGVLIAASGAEMYAQLENNQVDLILLDLGLLDGDGLTLLQDIRKTSKIPVIVATARQKQDDRNMALNLGADDYVTKPFDPRELMLRIRNRLGGGPPTAGEAAPQAPATPPTPPQPAPKLPIQATQAGGRGSMKAVGAIFAVALLAAAGWGAYWAASPKQPTPQPAPAAPAPVAALRPAPAPTPEHLPPLVEEIKKAKPAPAPKLKPKQTKHFAEVPGFGWVLHTKCSAMPKVEWWVNKSHLDVAGFVQRKHKGNWGPYLDRWNQRLANLQSIEAKGSGAKVPDGTIIRDQALRVYIEKMELRLKVLRCLQNEA